MLDCFQQWGMPKAVRSDNGEPFGVPTRDVVPMMSLWLKAWGIQPILNRPRRPQDNAHVENNQATAARWAEVYECKTVNQMQLKLDEVCHFQRDEYPVRRIGNATRKEVFAALYQKARPFEQAHFEPQAAYQMLAQVIYPRKVSNRGTISLYGDKFQAGLRLSRQTLLVKFDPKDRVWLCLDENNAIVKVITDERLSPDSLNALNSCE